MVATADGPDQQVAYWTGEIARAKKRFRTFWDNGDTTVDAYRLQKADGNDANAKDKYNILYSSTETIRPNLYAQTPKPRVELRSKDTASDTARAAALLLEGCLKYLITAEDFDELMDATVEDFLLPGLGIGWVRYEPRFGPESADGVSELLDEMVKIEYVYWQDFLTGVARTWKTTPWAARRIWINKKDATKRFDAVKANKLNYAQREGQARDMDNPSETAEIWEIWDKTTRTVYWFAEGLDTLLDNKPDPLKFKDFFPCPRPLRAISNTRTFVPRALYSQYKTQADTLNVLTRRIRLLGEALKVTGLYDGSQPKLADALNPASGNRMIAVDGWAQFAQNGGLIGSVQWVPIDVVVKTLNELLKAREICKQEIYEITGFGDILRGVSKASETLGAQNIKANWAGARVKKMQKEVQRYAKDLLALAGEAIAEHCAPETIAVFAGVEIPDPAAIQASPELQAKLKLFKDACAMIKSDIRRVSVIDIETDSTLAADDEAEQESRSKFLAAAGAFLQQAVPAMEATPELGPLLGALLMFTVRTFPASRVIEDEFEKVQQSLAAKAQQPQDQDKDGKKAKAAADAQAAQADAQFKQQELQVRQQKETAQAQNDATAETNRHAEKMAELANRQQELAIQQAAHDLAVENARVANQVALEDAKTRKFTAIHAAGIAEMGLAEEARAQTAEEEREYDQMDRADEHANADRDLEAESAEADRQHQTENAEADRQAQADAAEAKEAGQAAGGGEDA